MPDKLTPFVWLLSAFNGVCKSCDGDGEQELRRKLQELQETALFAWREEGSNAGSVEDWMVNTRHQMLAWDDFTNMWRKFIDSLSTKLQKARKLGFDGVIIIPVDDLDMRVHAVRQTLLALSQMNHPRVVYVVCGYIPQLTKALTWELARRIIGEGQPTSTGYWDSWKGDTADNPADPRTLAMRVIEKALPSNHHFDLPYLTLSQAWELPLHPDSPEKTLKASFGQIEKHLLLMPNLDIESRVKLSYRRVLAVLHLIYDNDRPISEKQSWFNVGTMLHHFRDGSEPWRLERDGEYWILIREVTIRESLPTVSEFINSKNSNLRVSIRRQFHISSVTNIDSDIDLGVIALKGEEQLATDLDILVSGLYSGGLGERIRFLTGDYTFAIYARFGQCSFPWPINQKSHRNHQKLDSTQKEDIAALNYWLGEEQLDLLSFSELEKLQVKLPNHLFHKVSGLQEETRRTLFLWKISQNDFDLDVTPHLFGHLIDGTIQYDEAKHHSVRLSRGDFLSTMAHKSVSNLPTFDRLIEDSQKNWKDTFQLIKDAPFSIQSIRVLLMVGKEQLHNAFAYGSDWQTLFEETIIFANSLVQTKKINRKDEFSSDPSDYSINPKFDRLDGNFTVEWTLQIKKRHLPRLLPQTKANTLQNIVINAIISLLLVNGSDCKNTPDILISHEGHQLCWPTGLKSALAIDFVATAISNTKAPDNPIIFLGSGTKEDWKILTKLILTINIRDGNLTKSDDASPLHLLNDLLDRDIFSRWPEALPFLQNTLSHIIRKGLPNACQFVRLLKRRKLPIS